MLTPLPGPSPADIRSIKRLQDATNVIPLLARADEITSQDVAAAKGRVVDSLHDQGVEWFSFVRPESAGKRLSIFAVSSAPRADCQAEDANLHMSFEILPSQASTDLEELIGCVFSPEGSSWLRYSAALKATSWRRRQLLGSASHFALTSRRLTTDGALVPHTGTNLYFERRHRGQIRFSSWAESLQQSLTAERVDRSPQTWSLGRKMLLAKVERHALPSQAQSSAECATVNPQDPLGLLELGSQVKQGGRLTLELMSSLGVFSCVAMWLIHPEMTRH